MYKKISLIVLALVSTALYAEPSYNKYRMHPISLQETRINSSIGVDILDRTSNRRLPIYFHNGKHYIVGVRNHEYQINLYNNVAPGFGRKLAIVSVDGVNVITGQTAGYSQSGYVMDSNSTVQIKGWRKNMNDVAKFYFTYPENSYASRTDRPDNTGVIGIAVFDEKFIPPPPPMILDDSDDRENSTYGGSAESMQSNRARESVGRSAPAAAPMVQKSELGTGHGSREHSSVVNTEFERASRNPSDTIVLYYDTYEHLVSLGIIRTNVPATPSPFPNGNRFVPDPR